MINNNKKANDPKKMAMASWMFRGRSLRTGRSIRSRHDSEDDVQLDLSKDTSENVRDILVNICKKHGLTEGKRFGYLNAFVKLVSKSNVNAGNLGYSVEEIQCCLRVALVHEASQVRAAVLRAVRYLLNEEKDVKTLNRLRYSFLIARSLDVSLRNDMERVQALRLVRRMLVLAPADFPPTLVRSLVALANGAAEEKDRMLRACLAVLSEICVLNSEVFILCGGVSAISRNILDCQMPRIAESLCGVLLFLLNSPVTRAKAGVRLQVLAAPYCDFHWDSSKNRDEREVRFHCSRLALLSVLRSWPGLLHFCHPSNSSGLKSIIDILYVKQLEVRKAVLDLLYDLLGLPQPEWTDEFGVALEAVDPSHPRDSWKLSEGFVASEGRAVLPHLSKYRPNLVEIHLSLLLYTFLEVGLLEAIVEVIVSSDTFISVRATILLGELLHMIHTLLPPECCNLTPALPNLLAHASSPSTSTTQHQALAAVATLSHLHQMLKRRPAPASLFLDQMLQAGGWGRTGTEDIGPGSGKVKREKSKLYQLMLKDGDDTLKESAVLTTKDGFSWNWNVVRAVLKSRSEALKKLEDSNHRTFVRRLVHYFKPSSNRFSRVELGNKRQTHMYTMAGCELIDCLLDADEPEGGKLLAELLADIWVQIDAITSSKSAHDCLFSPQHVSNSLCQDYFLFVGRLCRSTRGVRVLDKAGILQLLLNLVVSTNHECYVKLVVSSLDYSIDGMPRVILSKVLTAPSEASRLYATQFLLVLLRARLPDFAKWGVELLVMQLYDQSRAVSLAAIAILTEAAEEKVYLDAVVALRPSLLHLGDKGLLLLVRFLATPTGFTFLHDANFVTNQLERWATSYNFRYVRLVEGELHDSLTLHQRGEDGRYSRRVTSAKSYVRDVYVPPHLYGQLVQHDKGLQLLLRDTNLPTLFQCVHGQRCSSEQEILDLKAALWGCGHIATSPAGVGLLSEEGVIAATVRLAETCSVYSVRGTAFYVLGLMATTFQGANELGKTGWLCVRHHRHERWPVIEEEPDTGDLTHGPCQEPEPDNLSMSSVAAAWDLEPGGLGITRGAHAQRSFYIADEDESLASGDDEGMLLDESTCSARWTDLTGGSGAVFIPPPHQRKSQTLPHWRSSRCVPLPHRHIRSLSESKQPQMEEESAGDWSGDASNLYRSRESCLASHPPTGVMVVAPKSEESKSRSNSCTDSSGVSSCDSGLGKHTTSERIQTLSPIPSSTSLNTLKSSAILNRRSSQTSARKHSAQGSVTSEGAPSSPDTSYSRLSHQDLMGYATLRSLHRHRRPLYSDSTSLAAEELLGFEDHGGVSASAALARAMKARSLDHQLSHTVLCEFEATMPPQMLSGSSSVSLAARTYYGSRSNIGRQQGPSKEGELNQQCYMGICLPRQLAALFPQDEQGSQQPGQPEMTHRKGSASFSEMEQVQEAAEGAEGTSSTNSDDPDSPVKARSSFAADTYRHSAATCLSCCRMRDRKVSTSSYHRHRTDTESSYGGGESPVLYQRRRKSHSTSSCLLGATPGGSVESSNSLDVGSSQRMEEDSQAPSRALVRKEILRHVSRMSNPVWSKLSRQALLQLKQKYASIFQDVCLYSAVCHRMGSSTYRLIARRFIQELFLDLSFDVLYDDPAIILQMQPPPPSSSMERVSSSMSPPTGHLYTSQPPTSPKPPVSPAQSMGNFPTANTTQLSAPAASTLPFKSMPMDAGLQSKIIFPASEKSPVDAYQWSNGENISLNGKKLLGNLIQDTSVTMKNSAYVPERPKASDPVPIVTAKAPAMPGGFVVKSPPLEVVTEESGMSISSLECLSPMEMESNVSNYQADEEKLAFLNLQFDDIPMIDETVRNTYAVPERTTESVTKLGNPQVPQAHLRNLQGNPLVKSETLPIAATQLERSCEQTGLNLSKAAVASQVIKPIPVKAEIGNSDILVKDSHQERISQRSTHVTDLPKVNLSLQNSQVELQPVVSVPHERNQLNYKYTPARTSVVGKSTFSKEHPSGRESQEITNNIKSVAPSAIVSQTTKNLPSTDKSLITICDVPSSIKSSVHEVVSTSIDSQTSTYQHSYISTLKSTAFQKCLSSSSSNIKTTTSPAHSEQVVGAANSVVILSKLETVSTDSLVDNSAVIHAKQPASVVDTIAGHSAKQAVAATSSIPLVGSVATPATQGTVSQTPLVVNCSGTTTKQAVASAFTTGGSSPVTPSTTRMTVEKSLSVDSSAVNSVKQATTTSVSNIVHTNQVKTSTPLSADSSSANMTRIITIGTDLAHLTEVVAGTTPSVCNREATASVLAAPTSNVTSRQRKLATAAPPNISSLSEVPLANKNVPTSDNTKQNR